MSNDKKAMNVCNEAGVDTVAGAVLLVSAMCWIYRFAQNVGDLIINLFK